MSTLPIWKFLPAELAHKLAPIGLSYFANKYPEQPPKWRELSWSNIYFPNPLGIAGGVDKNASMLSLWPRLGTGFIEVGTVTPYAQSPNKGRIMDRDWDAQNLWNRMGFPSEGSDDVYYNIKHFRQDNPNSIPLFMNIGKNRTRPNEEAEIDYLYLVERFKGLCEAFVVNVSSPNTQGLRSLQNEQALRSLSEKIVIAAGKTPVLVKLSPDMSESDFLASLDACLAAKVRGFILTNTTLSRPAGCPFPTEGGLSGKSLAELSKKHLRLAENHFANLSQQSANFRSSLLIISAGGVLNADDVKERLDLGANLVQTYSGLVFSGPSFFRDVAEKMK